MGRFLLKSVRGGKLKVTNSLLREAGNISSFIGVRLEWICYSIALHALDLPEFFSCRAIMFWIKSRKEEQKGLPQYQRDFDLSPLGDHYMFWEYLEVGKLV